MLRDQDKKEFAATIIALGKSFGVDVDKELIKLYWMVLQDEFETIEDFKQAASKLLKTWQYSYMPKPAHFIEAVQGSENYELIATKAYGKAKEAAISYGVYHNLEFDDPFIAETILTLFASWKEFHDHVAYRDSDDTWVKRDFIRIYKAIAKNGQTSGKKLIGYLQEEFTSPIQIFCDYEPPKTKIQQQPAIANNVLKVLPNKRVQNG